MINYQPLMLMSRSRFLSAVLLGIMTCLLLGANTPEAKAESEGKPLVGDLSPEQLFEAFPSFAEGYVAFDAEADSIQLPLDTSVLVFFGTWCHDSEREVPRLLKLLRTAGLSEEKLMLIGLDYRKREPEGRAAQFDVQYTPTAIFLRQGVEVGRIVERPDTTLQEAIKQIFDVSI